MNIGDLCSLFYKDFFGGVDLYIVRAGRHHIENTRQIVMGLSWHKDDYTN